MGKRAMVLDGTNMAIKELNYFAKAVTNSDLEQVLGEGGDALVAAVQANLDGHDISGKLRQSIGYAFIRDGYVGGEVVGIDLGWRKLLRPSVGRKKVYTSTYGPILDNSHKRQLPHLQVGFEVASEYVVDHMRNRLQDIINSFGDPF